jgi:hypothetical protein
MLRCFARLACVLSCSLIARKPRGADSLVRIQATSQGQLSPWSGGEVASGVGRIHHHWEQNHDQRARCQQQPTAVSRKAIKALSSPGGACRARLCLALTVDDPRFFSTAPLHFGGIPVIESTVSVGYPIGGDGFPSLAECIAVDFDIFAPGVDSFDHPDRWPSTLAIAGTFCRMAGGRRRLSATAAMSRKTSATDSTPVIIVFQGCGRWALRQLWI